MRSLGNAIRWQLSNVVLSRIRDRVQILFELSPKSKFRPRSAICRCIGESGVEPLRSEADGISPAGSERRGNLASALFPKAIPSLKAGKIFLQHPPRSSRHLHNSGEGEAR